MTEPALRESVREAVQKATWIGFDLDDTLHDFRGASSSATPEVLDIICKSHNYRTPIEDLQATYKSILREKTAGAFIDGKTSHEYRAERFATLLNRCPLPMDHELVQSLVSQYEIRLSASLKLKDGAGDVLDLIRKKGKKIMVITEGPQDAQERTVKQLLGGKIDSLVTTNKFGVSKVDGLFSEVLKQFDTLPSQMVYVGDSLERDIIPATSVGIFAIHFDEGPSTTNPKSKKPANYTITVLSDLKEVVETLG